MGVDLRVNKDHFCGSKRPIAELIPGQRIKIARRIGTFCGYYRIENFPHVIEWVPDGLLETEVIAWTFGDVEVSEWDEIDTQWTH